MVARTHLIRSHGSTQQLCTQHFPNFSCWSLILIACPVQAKTDSSRAACMRAWWTSLPWIPLANQTPTLGTMLTHTPTHLTSYMSWQMVNETDRVVRGLSTSLAWRATVDSNSTVQQPYNAEDPRGRHVLNTRHWSGHQPVSLADLTPETQHRQHSYFVIHTSRIHCQKKFRCIRTPKKPM